MHILKLVAAVIIGSLLAAPATAQDGHPIRFPVGDSGHGYAVPAGPVPNAAKAITFARAVLIPIYGARTIHDDEPLIATRKGDIWTVQGTLNCGMSWWQKFRAARCLGGTAELELSAKTGQVLHVTHYH